MKLVLENGQIFYGNENQQNFTAIGELVFNTSTTGYQEIISDPSYHKQIIVFTNPLIGNYGINKIDFESLNFGVSGVVLNQYPGNPEHHEQCLTLTEALNVRGVPLITGIDTRQLVAVIKKQGTIKAKICSSQENNETVIGVQKNTQFVNHVNEVSTNKAYKLTGHSGKIVVLDFGVKKGILCELNRRGFETIVVPYNYTYEQIMKYKPDGVLLSNGPGNPANVELSVLEVIKKLSNQLPIFGICLGHQLFALSYGAETEKLLFGHRGSNHPVKNLKTGKIFMTSQNHSYTVKPESIKKSGLLISEIAVNENSVEALKHPNGLSFSVQYHPEASPGPHDSNFWFDKFVQKIQERHNNA